MRLLGRLPLGGIFRVSIAVGGLALALFLSMTPVQAQATRTWVSGVGDDANPCSRTAPCKTFAGAISKTANGGIINCIDPGGFGAVTITKSMTIDCRNTMAGVLATGGISGIVINDTGAQAGGIRVDLRGLSIEGVPNGTTGTPGARGINIIKAGYVNVEDCHIFGFNGGVARGIDVPGNVAVGSFTQLSVRNTLIEDNGVSIVTGGGVSGGGGIVIGNVSLSPNAGVIRATLDNVSLVRNNIGLRVSPAADVTVKGSVMAHSISFNMIVASGGSSAVVNADDTVFAESIGGTGIHVENAGSVVRLSRSTITGNNVGLAAVNGGSLLSAGNNLVQGNFGGNGAFTGVAPLN